MFRHFRVGKFTSQEGIQTKNILRRVLNFVSDRTANFQMLSGLCSVEQNINLLVVSKLAIASIENFLKLLTNDIGTRKVT